MTLRSDLTTEVEKALRDIAYDGGNGPMSEVEFTRYVRSLAEATVEVVEESAAPTAVSGLLADARARLTASRLGKSIMREMDADIMIIRRLVEALEAEPSEAVANAVARAIIDHDEERHTCYDHPEDFCCPCGTHAMSRSEWQRHQARAALRAAAVTDQGEAENYG